MYAQCKCKLEPELMIGSGDDTLQQTKWLGDMCEGGVEKCTLEAGDTMIIPAGYIHAVVSFHCDDVES
jgi:oxalate decarboxylase/phosphoglucose isomerase-like protein (cupin superfamily)